jgi:hypothetical protein
MGDAVEAAKGSEGPSAFVIARSFRWPGQANASSEVDISEKA